MEGYNWKEKIVIALETDNDIHFKTIFFAKMTFILKRREHNNIGKIILLFFILFICNT